MTTLLRSQAPTHIQDYLKDELRSDNKHEYQLGDTGCWEHLVYTQADDTLALRCLDMAVTLRDVYAEGPELLVA